MAKFESFTFRLDRTERQLLTDLAGRLARSRADTLRLLVREALAGLQEREALPVVGQQERATQTQGEARHV